MSKCLTADELQRLARGQLDAESAAEARSHLSACPTCRSRYARDPAAETLADAPTTPPSDPNATIAVDRGGPPSDPNATIAVDRGGPPPSGESDTVAAASRATGGADETITLDRNARGDETIALDVTVIGRPQGRVEQRYPTIDGYNIIGVLGQGGMGIVYRAVQVKLHRTVALKVLPAIVGTASASAVSRFRREATAAASLHHTNIIPIYDFGESADGYYYAMELITGQPLDDFIGRFLDQDALTASPVRLAEMLRAMTTESPAPSDASDGDSAGADAPTVIEEGRANRAQAYYRRVARWIADTADALDYAHKQGIIHRDIKPANLILSVDGRIMVADFGLAKTAGDQSVTMEGTFVGSLRYASPEQAMAKRVPVDHRTDIYSLGGTMYELLCFRPTFAEFEGKELVGAVLTREPVPPRKIAPAIPAELETICLKTLEKTPEARYATAKALADDLRRYINDLPIAAKRPGPILRARKFVRRHRVGVVATTAVVLLAVAVPVIIQTTRQRRAAEASRKLEEAARNAAEFVSRAHVAENQRMWSRAANLYRAALEVDPNNVPALGNFARMMKEQVNWAESQNEPVDPSWLEDGIRLCDRAIALEPQEYTLWNTKGILLKKLRRYDEAVTAYERALALNRDFSASWENLGIVQAMAGELESAESNVRKAAELAGTDEADCVYPWRNLAAIELYLAKPEALTDLQNALECERHDAASYRLLLRLHLALPGYVNLPKAVELADRADFLIDEKDPIVKRLRAEAMLRHGDPESAIRYADQAVRLGDDPASADHLLIALANVALDRTDAARTAYDQAVASWPADWFDEGAVRVIAPQGVLWFDAAADLFRLRGEVEAALRADGS